MFRAAPHVAGSPGPYSPDAGENLTPNAGEPVPEHLAQSGIAQRQNRTSPPPPPLHGRHAGLQAPAKPSQQSAPAKPSQESRESADDIALMSLDVEPPEQAWVGFDSHWEDTPSSVQADWLPPLPASARRPKAARPRRQTSRPPALPARAAGRTSSAADASARSAGAAPESIASIPSVESNAPQSHVHAWDAVSSSQDARSASLRLPPEAPAQRTPRGPAWMAGWAAGIAVVLGAAGLVAAGYSAAYIQQLLHVERTPVLITAASSDGGSHGPARPSSIAPAVVPRADADSVDSVPRTPDVTSAEAAAASEPSRTAASQTSARPAASALQAEQRGHLSPRHSHARSRKSHTSRERRSERKDSKVQSAEELALSAAAQSAEELALSAEPQPAAAPAPEPEPAGAVEAQATGSAEPLAAELSPPVLTVTPLGPDTQPSAVPQMGGEQQLPRRPSRDQVKDTMLAAWSKLTECAGDVHGTSYANLTISADGRVTYSLIDGALAGTPEGSCMARALRTVSFPRFSGPPFKVRYPVVF